MFVSDRVRQSGRRLSEETPHPPVEIDVFDVVEFVTGGHSERNSTDETTVGEPEGVPRFGELLGSVEYLLEVERVQIDAREIAHLLHRIEDVLFERIGQAVDDVVGPLENPRDIVRVGRVDGFEPKSVVVDDLEEATRVFFVSVRHDDFVEVARLMEVVDAARCHRS